MQSIKKTGLAAEAYQKALTMQRIGNDATHKAQELNRSKGIPNFNVIAGRIVSDREGITSPATMPASCSVTK